MRVASRVRVIGVVGLMVAILGCSRAQDPTLGPAFRAPESELEAFAADGSGDRFYPLEIGSRWNYRGGFKLALDDGNGPLQVIADVSSTTYRVMQCDQEIEDRVYRVEYAVQVEWSTYGPRAFHSWIRYREDRNGLYERDITGATPGCSRPDPSRTTAVTAERSVVEGLDDPRLREAARTALARVDVVREVLRRGPFTGLEAAGSGEITRLRYPLVTGATWTIRSDPRVEATVEGLDHFEVESGLLPAYRIRIDWPVVSGPHDLIHVWYGRAGYLGMNAHLEFGSDIGLMIADETETLVGLDLVHGRF